jgi:hypothetical protein
MLRVRLPVWVVSGPPRRDRSSNAMPVTTSHPSPVRADSLVLLAPSAAVVPNHFADVDVDPTRHAHLLEGLQRLRGGVYVGDGALESERLAGGRHIQAIDDASWHVVSMTGDGAITACARLRAHRPGCDIQSLGVWSSALARSTEWADRLRNAIGADLAMARLRNVHYVEFGGWAVGEEWRRTTTTVSTAMATYALGECLGGFLGVTTATVRHCSSRMLRKLGGHSFDADGAEVPSYFDPQYGCDMELLRFDSRLPTHRYGGLVGDVVRSLWSVPIVCATAADQGAHAVHRMPRRPVVADRHVPCFNPGEFAATA